jgi:hypothetical protein
LAARVDVIDGGRDVELPDAIAKEVCAGVNFPPLLQTLLEAFVLIQVVQVLCDAREQCTPTTGSKFAAATS